MNARRNSAVAGGWTTFRLGNVCSKIGSGATPRGGGSVYLYQGDFALIRSQNVYNNGFHHDGLVYLTGQHAAELANVEVADQDVLLNITGDSVARTCQVDPRILPARVNQHVAIIRPDPRLLWPRFLRYYLASPNMQAQMLSIAGSGATRSALTKGMIESFEVHAPRSVAEQRAIAGILGSLDDKIELNRRMNETLEAMARAIFKSWFIDPASDGIPDGWRESTIGDEVRVVGGSTPSTERLEYWDGGSICWATPKDLSTLSSPILLETERRITEKGLAQISSGLLPAGTVLLSSRAPIGYLAISEVPVAVNQGFIAMVCDKALPPLYVWLWAEAHTEEIKGRANGTTFQEISKSNFRPISVAVPPRALLDRFLEVVSPLHRCVIENVQESRTFAAIRDALLPKLISGKIRVELPNCEE